MAVIDLSAAGPEKSRNDARTRGRPAGEAPLHQRFIDDLDLRHMGRTLWRWRGVIAAVTLAAVIICAFVVNSLTPIYTATAQIAVAQPQVPLLKLDQIVGDLKGDNEQIGTEIGIIKSRKIAQKTILKLGLDSMPEFNPTPGPFDKLVSWVRTQHYVSLPWVHDDAPAADVPDNEIDRRLDKVVDIFLDRLKATNDGKSRIVTLTFSSESPELASQIVNTVGDFYITAQMDSKMEAMKRASLWLSDQLAALRQDVLASDDAVERFRRDHGLVRGQTSTITSQEMSQVSTEAMTAHTKRLEAQSRLVQLQRAAGRGGDNSALPEVLQSPIVQRLHEQEADASARLADLSAHYGDKYPAVINARAQLAETRSKIQVEIAKVADALRTEASNQQAREDSLNALMGKVKAEASRSDINEVQLHELEREAQANKTLYENLLERFKQTQSQQNFQQADAEIISPAARPGAPSFPQKSVLILLSVLTGIMLGSFIALICENMDVGVRSMEQVEEILRVNPLGMVPVLGAGGVKRRRPEREALERPMSAYSEAMRTVQANILLSDVDARPRTILVTSSLPGEGKSTAAISLAYTMARDGQRVLLIDCDLRRPTVHRLAGVEPGPGLADWLLDKSNFDDVVRKHEESGVNLITAGHLPSVPPNLLGSQRFQHMLQQMRQHYDTVILDSAPVLAIADTRVLSALADTTVFIVHWASTSRRVVATAIDHLHRAGANIAGVVLTRVDVKSHAKDGFSDSVLYSGRLKHYYKEAR